jgi:twinkle protein
MNLLADLKELQLSYDKPEVKRDYSKDLLYLDDATEKTMLHYLKVGRVKGISTHYKSLDKIYTRRKGETNLWTGYNNEGKSALLNDIDLCMSIGNDWKHIVFTPENFPAVDFYTDLAETFTGKSADPAFKNVMTDREMLEAVKFIKAHFILIYPHDGDFTVDTLFNAARYAQDRHKADTIAFDPYLKIHHKYERGEGEHQYAARFMMQLVHLTKELEVCTDLVMHQVTPRLGRDKNGQEEKNYPKPSMYNIKGGGSFADGTDNVCGVWRPYRKSDPDNTAVMFFTDKIKKQKLVGRPGSTILDYHRGTSRYLEPDLDWLEEFNARVPDGDWRTAPDKKCSSPIARLKGEAIVQQQPLPMYGSFRGNGLDSFESQTTNKKNDDKAPF